MRSWHKRFGVIAGFLILLLLLVLNTAVLRYQLAVQVGHQGWFSHSKRVVQALRDTESLIKDAETSQRGYLYTGKVEYLAEASELSENPSLLRRPGFSNDLITVRIADSPIKYPLF